MLKAVDRAPSHVAVQADHADALPLDPSTILRFLQRHVLLLIAGATIGGLIGLAYLAVAVPLYEAKSTILLDAEDSSILRGPTINGEAPLDTARVDSQVELILSDTILAKAIERLDLVNDPEFGVVEGEGGDGLAFLDGIKDALFGPQIDELVTEEDQLRATLSKFRDNVDVSRRGLTYVVDVAFRSREPQKAALIANTLPDIYIENELGAKLDTTQRTNEWLNARLEELRNRSLLADEAVEAYRIEKGLDESGGTTLEEVEVNEFNRQLLSARLSRDEAQAKLDQINAVLSSDVQDGAVPDTLANSAISSLRERFNDVSILEADYTRRLGDQHPQVRKLRDELAQIRAQIRGELRRIASTYESELRIAESRVESIEASLGSSIEQAQDTNLDLVQLRNLEIQSQTARSLYENFLQRSMQLNEEASFPTSSARIISPAQIPSAKVSPNRKLVMAASVALGLLTVTALAFLWEMLDHTFRTGNHVRQVLGLPFLAHVPLLRRLRRPSVAGDKEGRVLAKKLGALRVVLNDPPSSFLDALSTVKLECEKYARTGQFKVMSFTAVGEGAGKTFMNTNLAQLLAHQGHRVLLIDLDLRRSTLSRLVTKSVDADVLDVISDKVRLSDAIWRDPVTNLELLPARLTSAIDVTEHLSSPNVAAFFEEVRSLYDFVIVDLPPIFPTSDVRALAPFIDGFVLTIDWGTTKKESAREALTSLPIVEEKTIGAVLNKTDIDRLWRFYPQAGSELTRAYSYGAPGKVTPRVTERTAKQGRTWIVPSVADLRQGDRSGVKPGDVNAE